MLTATSSWSGRIISAKTASTRRLRARVCCASVCGRFSKKPAIVKTGERIGDGIQFEFLEIFMLDNDGHAEEARGCEHVHQCGFESNLPACLVRHRAAPRERFVPHLDALRFAQLDVTDRPQETLEELSPCRQVKALERIRKQLEIRILDRQT